MDFESDDPPRPLDSAVGALAGAALLIAGALSWVQVFAEPTEPVRTGFGATAQSIAQGLPPWGWTCGAIALMFVAQAIAMHRCRRAAWAEGRSARRLYETKDSVLRARKLLRAEVRSGAHTMNVGMFFDAHAQRFSSGMVFGPLKDLVCDALELRPEERDAVAPAVMEVIAHLKSVGVVETFPGEREEPPTDGRYLYRLNPASADVVAALSNEQAIRAQSEVYHA